MEIWKDIPGYEGIYQASNYGNIRTVEGKTTYSIRHGKRRWKSRMLKGRGDNKTTGKRVSLWKNKKHKDWLVARLVAITFLGEPEEGMTVNHIDGNRMNNRIENLEWLTRADNIKHGFENGLYPQKSITLVNGKNEILSFRSFSECSRYLGRCHNYISGCVKKGTTIKNLDGEKFSILREAAQ